MLTPTVEIKNYFYNTISYNKNEKRIARDILNGFEIKTSNDLYRFGQYIKYKSDYVWDLTQTMQTIDFTLYEGTGDCEDFTRAYVKLLKELGLPAYYWLMFRDVNYQNGHAVPLYINEEGYLSILNYTTYYIVDTIKITAKDIEENTEVFQQAFNILHGNLISTFGDYHINWIIKTNAFEHPQGYLDMDYAPSFQPCYQKSYPHDRTFVLKYIQKMNLKRNIVVSDFLLPLGTFLLFYFLVRCLK